MKVGMLTSIGDRCGIAVYSHDLAESLRSLVDLDVVPVWDRTSPWEAYLAESTERLNNCDIVHIQHEYSFWGSVLPGQNKFFHQVSSIRKPIVLTAHTLDPASQVLGLSLPGSSLRKLVKRVLAAYPPYRQVIERKTFQVADRILVHDSCAASRLESRGIPKSNIRVIPMGVPAADLSPGLGDAFRRKHGLEGRKLIVIFGFIRPGRGCEATLNALAHLEDDPILVLAGGCQTSAQESYLRSLQEEIRSLGLERRVVITGYLPDEEVPGLMQAADVLLLPQETGTGSYSLQVALAYGQPILASDLECFADLECVLWTFRRGDSNDLCEKLGVLLKDEDARNRLAAKARSYAEKHTWGKIASKTAEVYKELA